MLVRFQPGLPFELESRILAVFLLIARSITAQESKKLRVVYDSLQTIGKRNFDVYAIADGKDIDRWKKYVKENNYPWLNVGGNKGNLDYLEHFNIMSNPAMFIMDNKDHTIILNKRIEMSNIPQFLEEYEKMKEKKRDI